MHVVQRLLFAQQLAPLGRNPGEKTTHMTDQNNPPKAERLENLELNKETVQDLTEEDTQGVQGGLRFRPPAPSEPSCDAGCE